MDQNKTALFKTNINGWPRPNLTTSGGRKSPKQLLKWIGNKQRFAQQICSVFPLEYNKYIEPFAGSGAILGAMAPQKGIAGDMLRPLIDMWKLLQKDPDLIYKHYEDSWMKFGKNKELAYKQILSSYNENPNPLDLVFISRSCYGGVIRFTKKGKMSTPIGSHNPISPKSFKERMISWRNRILGTEFICADFKETMSKAKEGDIVYCDPPYVNTQKILYGAQSFELEDLWTAIENCKEKGAMVALSIDGKKKSKKIVIDLGIPKNLFKRKMFVYGGSSMLRRFQKKNSVMNGEDVHDRLLLTW